MSEAAIRFPSRDRRQTPGVREPYSPRPVRFLDLWTPNGWSVKTYGISYRAPEPSADLVVEAKRLVRPTLTALTARVGVYPVGFLGIHDGRDCRQVFFDVWARENEIGHRRWVGDPGDVGPLRPAEPDDAWVCVWDVVVQAFEAHAWRRHILANPEGPDLAAYLAERLSTVV